MCVGPACTVPDIVTSKDNHAALSTTALRAVPSGGRVTPCCKASIVACISGKCPWLSHSLALCAPPLSRRAFPGNGLHARSDKTHKLDLTWQSRASEICTENGQAPCSRRVANLPFPVHGSAQCVLFSYILLPDSVFPLVASIGSPSGSSSSNGGKQSSRNLPFDRITF